MALPERISALIERFERNYDSYKSNNYNETRVRIEFIDPFFKELGWDVDNTHGFAETYKDVIHEDAIKVEGSNKAPDYSFRIGGVRKFFLEAKKPAVNLKDDIAPAYQLRRYAWNAQLPVSILTDFEEFAVYDTSVKPDLKDKASTARIFYCTFREYEEHWEYLSGLFAKESILKGSFDELTKDNKKKRGTTPVDKEFLKEMEVWRNDLARNIALRNKLSIQSLNYVVQATIDRILFLRICEDRNIEDYRQLEDLAKKPDIYENLKELFAKADAKYNSGLFHFKKEKNRDSAPDELSLSLQIDDKILKQIIAALYYPSPYEFAVISADILGNVYEQFLGKVIRLTPGGQAKVEEKPEVKKAGGVFYTPQYIVEYIVKNTVGELLKEKTPAMVAGKAKGHTPLRILDPACGSGSFLIYAYQYLLDWHRDWYENTVKNDPKKSKTFEGSIYPGPGGHWYLTTQEKKSILLNNIFGVDIDPQAVEVTKLNLLLKVLEGENRETIGSNLKLFQERALPDLGDNIKCGNSLIDLSIIEDHLFQTDKDSDLLKINPFDWKRSFDSIFDSGGFTCIIGNPPYIRIQTLNDSYPEQVEFFNQHYKDLVSGNYDIYLLFLYKAQTLLSIEGRMGFILPHKFFQSESGTKIRKFFSENRTVSQIVNFGTNQIFENATTYTCLFFCENRPREEFAYVSFDLGSEFKDISDSEFRIQKIADLALDMWNFHNPKMQNILNKIKDSGPALHEITLKIFKGSSTGDDSVYLVDLVNQKGKLSKVFSHALDKEVELESSLLRPFVKGQNIRMFFITKTNKFLLYPYIESANGVELIDLSDLKKDYPKCYHYFSECRSLLQKRKIRMSNSDYYKYSAARSLNYYAQPKIMIPDMLVSNRISFDNTGEFMHGPAIHSLVFDMSKTTVSDLAYLAILNSEVFWFFIKNTSTALRGDAFRLTPEFIAHFNFPNIDQATEKTLTDFSASLIHENQKLASVTSSSNERNLTENKIQYLIESMNRFVFQLYNFSEDEVKTIKSTSS